LCVRSCWAATTEESPVVGITTERRSHTNPQLSQLASEHTEADNDRDRALDRHFVALAIVVYGWAQTKSGARKALWSYVTVPSNLVSTHEQVAKFRNQTIGQSENENENENERKYVMADLTSEAGSVTVDRTLVVTSASPAPHAFVHRFQALVPGAILGDEPPFPNWRDAPRLNRCSKTFTDAAIMDSPPR
jgi:hypothetical protein